MKPHQDRLSSSSDYQREAEATRHRFANDLDELTDRLTPGQVFDEMLTYASGGGGTFFRALSNATRQNPLPTLLIGAGCMMFLSEKLGFGRHSYRDNGGPDSRSIRAASKEAPSNAISRFRVATGTATDTVASGVRSTAASVRAGVSRTTDFASERASNVADAVKASATSVGDTLSNTTQAMRASAQDLSEQAAGAADQIKRSAQDTADTVQDYASAIAVWSVILRPPALASESYCPERRVAQQRP